MVLQYADSGYSWVGGVVDDDLLGSNVTWYNSTNGIIQQNLTLLSTDMLYTPSSIFRDIENSYTLSVIASDINFTVAENITFNITDSLDPVCTGVSNRTWFTNVSTAFNIQCTDESLYSFSLDCGTYKQNITGLDTTLYSFTNATSFAVNTTCNWRVADGHTAREIDFSYISEDGSLKFDGNSLIVSTNEPFDDFSAVKDKDRYKFNVKTKANVNKVKFTVTSDDYIHIVKNSEYIGHLISGNKWIDFEEFDASFTEIDRVSDKEVNVVVYFKKVKKDFKFKSIGELNIVEGSFDIGLTEPIIPLLESFVCPSSTALQIALWMIMLVGLMIIILGNASGWKWLGLFGYLIWIFGSFVVIGCFVMAGILMLLATSLLFARYLFTWGE